MIYLHEINSWRGTEEEILCSENYHVVLSSVNCGRIMSSSIKTELKKKLLQIQKQNILKHVI